MSADCWHPGKHRARHHAHPVTGRSVCDVCHPVDGVSRLHGQPGPNHPRSGGPLALGEPAPPVEQIITMSTADGDGSEWQLPDPEQLVAALRERQATVPALALGGPAPPAQPPAHVELQLWTDGASSPDGRGGWAYILAAVDRHGHVVKREDRAGGEYDTTNNRMELTAVIRGLQALTHPAKLTVYCDSSYVVNAFLENWFAKWDRDSWTVRRKHGRREVANQDLWRELRAIAATHTITWQHIKGHSGHPLNEEADRLAVAAKVALVYQNGDGEAAA